jgi:hypothetical protein
MCALSWGQEENSAMPKIDINQVAEIMKRNAVEPELLRQIIAEMQAATQPELDEEKPPAVKKQWCILISDPDGRLPAEAEFVGWVLQIPEHDSPVTTIERIHRAAYDFNATKRGRLLPANTVGEAIENVAAKHFKEVECWVKSKIPVLMLRTDNQIPTTDSDKDTLGGRVN